jgi:hypothetical protein
MAGTRRDRSSTSRKRAVSPRSQSTPDVWYLPPFPRTRSHGSLCTDKISARRDRSEGLCWPLGQGVRPHRDRRERRREDVYVDFSHPPPAENLHRPIPDRLPSQRAESRHRRFVSQLGRGPLLTLVFLLTALSSRQPRWSVRRVRYRDPAETVEQWRLVLWREEPAAVPTSLQVGRVGRGRLRHEWEEETIPSVPLPRSVC